MPETNPSFPRTMKAPPVFNTKLTGTFCIRTPKSAPIVKRVSHSTPPGIRFPVTMTTGLTHSSATSSSSDNSRSPRPAIASDVGSGLFGTTPAHKLQSTEQNIEKAIYGCRFFTILAVWGSLIGSFLCFIKGSTYVIASYQQYFVHRAKVILMLVEAIDVYLLGTVMLVFGMGLYELFISNLDIAKSLSEERTPHRSNLFGLFTLKERPKWLEVKTVNELKTKIGHVIVMLLLIGLFDKSKKAIIHTSLDLLYFSASVLLSSGSLYLLSKLKGSEGASHA